MCVPKYGRSWRGRRDGYSAFILLARHEMFDLFANGKPEEALSAVIESARFWKNHYFFGDPRRLRGNAYKFLRFSAQLSMDIRFCGMPEEALSLSIQAVEDFKELVATDSIFRRREIEGGVLANAVYNLAMDLFLSGKCEEGLPFAQEAMELYREQAEEEETKGFGGYSKNYLLAACDLVNALNECGTKGEGEAAFNALKLKANQEITEGLHIGITRMAEKCHSFASCMRHQGRYEEAFNFSMQAVMLCREIATDGDRGDLAYLISSLELLIADLARCGKTDETYTFVQEVKSIRDNTPDLLEDIVSNWDGLFIPFVLFDNCGKDDSILHFMDKSYELIYYYDEWQGEKRYTAFSVPICRYIVKRMRELAEKEWSLYLPRLALFIGILADNLRQYRGKPNFLKESSELADEAANLYKELTKADRDKYLGKFKESLERVENFLLEEKQGGKAFPFVR